MDNPTSKTVADQSASRLDIINGMFPTKEDMAREILRLESYMDGLAGIVLADKPYKDLRNEIKRLRAENLTLKNYCVNQGLSGETPAPQKPRADLEREVFNIVHRGGLDEKANDDLKAALAWVLNWQNASTELKALRWKGRGHAPDAVADTVDALCRERWPSEKASAPQTYYCVPCMRDVPSEHRQNCPAGANP